MKSKKSKIHELKTVNRTGVSKTKQFLFTMAFLAISFMSFAQVGIGTVTPEGALDIVSTDSGLILPRVANTAAVTTPVDGMLIYDISSTCIKAYENGAWSDCLSAAGGGGSSVTNDCDANGIVGSYVAGIALNSGNTFSVTITNSSFSTVDITFQSSDVTLSGASSGDITVGAPTGSPALSGGTATLTAGSSVIVTYPLTGTPSTTGTLTLDWAKLSLSCTKTVDVTGLSGAFDANYCSTTAFNGTYVNAVAFSGNSFTVDITNTSGATVSSMPAPTTADLGLSFSGTGTLTVSSVSPNSTFSVANGATQTFTYTLSGTPTSVGTITATWNYADFMCTDTRDVGNGDATFTSAINNAYIFSVNDVSVPLNNQGTLTIGTTIDVPYTSGLGFYNAYTSPDVAIDPSFAEDGASDWTFGYSYPSGTFSGSGDLVVTILVKKAGVLTDFDALRVSSITTINFDFVNLPLVVEGGVKPNTIGLDEGGDAIRGGIANGGGANGAAYDAASVNDLVEISAAEYNGILSVVPGAFFIGLNNWTGINSLGTGSYMNDIGSASANANYDGALTAPTYVTAFRIQPSYSNGSSGRLAVVTGATSSSGMTCISNESALFTADNGEEFYFAVKRPSTSTGSNSALGIKMSNSTASFRMRYLPTTGAPGGKYNPTAVSCGNTLGINFNTDWIAATQYLCSTQKSW